MDLSHPKKLKLCLCSSALEIPGGGCQESLELRAAPISSSQESVFLSGSFANGLLQSYRALQVAPPFLSHLQSKTRRDSKAKSASSLGVSSFWPHCRWAVREMGQDLSPEDGSRKAEGQSS